MRFPLFIDVIKYVLPLQRSICIPGLNVLCFMFLQPAWKLYRSLFLREREGPMLTGYIHMEKEVRIYEQTGNLMYTPPTENQACPLLFQSNYLFFHKNKK